MQMRFIDVDGVPTRCLTAGSQGKPALLLVHGMTLTCDIWSRNIDYWASSRFVIAPDMLGHGFTRPKNLPQQIDIAAKIKHLISLVQTFGYERFAICASSYGALIASNLYLLYPSACTALILNGSGSCFNTESQLIGTVGRTHATYEDALKNSTPQAWCEHLKRSVFDTKTIPEHLPYILALVYAQSWIADYWAHTVESMSRPALFRRYRVLERLNEFEIPALILWGKEDHGAPLKSAQNAIGAMPDAQLIAFDRCGHLPMLEHAEAINKAVQEFLDLRNIK